MRFVKAPKAVIDVRGLPRHFTRQDTKNNYIFLKNQIDDIKTNKYIPLKAFRNARKCQKAAKTSDWETQCEKKDPNFEATSGFDKNFQL